MDTHQVASGRVQWPIEQKETDTKEARWASYITPCLSAIHNHEYQNTLIYM